MDNAKKVSLIEKLFFVFLVIFPFGQLLRFEIPLFGKIIPVQPLDVLSLIFFGIFLTGGFKLPKIFKYVTTFLIVGVFSQLVFVATHGIEASMVGMFYLLRLFAYGAMFFVYWNLFGQKPEYQKKVVNILILLSSAIAVLGWIQYWLFPDLTVLKEIGWDDHLFRLVGTFLDPTYTGILICFGALLSFAKFQETKKIKMLAVFLLNVFALAFTYSRASYLAFLVGLGALIMYRRKIKVPLIILPVFLIGLLFLPRPGGEGVRLERTASIIGRLGNYKETAYIFSKNPLFGVGYNNLCWYRQTYLPLSKVEGHACGGADSSILYLMATMGVVGTILFFTLGWKSFILVSGSQKVYLFVLGMALLVHSLFSNSIFYPWVVGYMIILLSGTMRKN
jgi:O-antigen ligase